MIRGVLFRPRQLPTALASGRPFVSATIQIPSLSVQNSLNLLADTGADRTSLHLGDVVRIIGLRKFRQLDNQTIVKGMGIGGSAEYFVEPAHIAFKHEDGQTEGFHFALQIAKPSDKATAEFRSKMYPWTQDTNELARKAATLSKETREELTAKSQIPSVLGTDILSQFCLIIKWSSGEFYLGH